MDGRVISRRLAAIACVLPIVLLGSPRGAATQEGTYDTPHGRISASLDCAKCHTSESWAPRKSPMEFDHDSQTGFALTGRHAEADCTRCHLRRQFDQPKGSTTRCATCHVDVHQGVLGSDCSLCHRTDEFTSPEETEDAHGRSSFPLTGAHEQISCESCHEDDSGGRFSPLDTDCFSCHEADYRNAQFVDHEAQGFPTDCLQCHSVIAWRDAPAFDHATAANGFELLGAHAQTACENCHQRPGNELLFAPGGQDDCVACHQADYERRHAGTGFSTDCAGCHGVDDWDDADFDHRQTGFELLGAHASADCGSCHTQPGNELINTPSGQDDCVACHQADYDQEHTGTGFPTTCLSCHDTSQWTGATWDHAQTGFDLVGAHLSLACDQCHSQPGNVLVFPTPSAQDDCVACHQADYDQEHTGTGFPTTCLSCHDTSQWTGAFFDHDGPYFPIYSGKHQGKWNDCSDCHTSPGNFQLFSCLNCHEHRQSAMDDKHKNEPAYVYQSSACLSCHPAGRKDD